MRQLLEDYKRRLKTISEELTIAINEATDIEKITRLTIQRGCYRTFISEMERILPPDKPIDPKILEQERLEQEERDKKDQERLDEWNKRMLAGEFEDKEDDTK